MEEVWQREKLQIQLTGAEGNDGLPLHRWSTKADQGDGSSVDRTDKPRVEQACIHGRTKRNNGG